MQEKKRSNRYLEWAKKNPKTAEALEILDGSEAVKKRTVKAKLKQQQKRSASPAQDERKLFWFRIKRWFRSWNSSSQAELS